MPVVQKLKTLLGSQYAEQVANNVQTEEEEEEKKDGEETKSNKRKKVSDEAQV